MKLFSFFIILFSSIFLYSGHINNKENNKNILKQSKEKISWYSFTDGIAKAKKENKYIFIYFYANWCNYCKKLDKETYSNEIVYTYLSDNFIPIKVDVESSERVMFAGKSITQKELAESFGVSAYPSLFFMETEKKEIGRLPGFIAPQEFLTIASYVGSNAFKTKSIDEYKSSLSESSLRKKKYNDDYKSILSYANSGNYEQALLSFYFFII